MYILDENGTSEFFYVLSKYDSSFGDFYDNYNSFKWVFDKKVRHYGVINDLMEAVTTDPESFEGDYQKKFYYNLHLPKSDFYIKNLNAFIDLMYDAGVSSSYWPWDDDAPYENTLFFEKAWNEGGEVYSLLEETGDYWWFLVAFIQNYSSWSHVRFSEVNSFLKEVIESGHEGFSIDWFTPFKTWFTRESLRVEFENSKKDVVKDTNALKSVDFSSLNKVNVENIPEYDLDDYVENEGGFYDPFDVYLAITASGGLAQSLERQDLEGSIEGIGKMVKKRRNKKVKK